MCVGPLKKKKQQATSVAPPPPPAPAATAVLGDRVAVGAGAGQAGFGLAGLNLYTQQLMAIAGLNGPARKPTDPNAVGAGRIGRAYGASDLRIGG